MTAFLVARSHFTGYYEFSVKILECNPARRGERLPGDESVALLSRKSVMKCHLTVQGAVLSESVNWELNRNKADNEVVSDRDGSRDK